MISVTVSVKNTITKDLQKKAAALAKVPQQAFTFFKAHTPIDTGNARSRTSLNKDTIHAAYPYAQRLDQGYSRQAPDGMSKPTEAYVQKTVDQIIRKK
jgi:hypothetical protein